MQMFPFTFRFKITTYILWYDIQFYTYLGINLPFRYTNILYRSLTVMYSGLKVLVKVRKQTKHENWNWSLFFYVCSWKISNALQHWLKWYCIIKAKIIGVIDPEEPEKNKATSRWSTAATNILDTRCYGCHPHHIELTLEFPNSSSVRLLCWNNTPVSNNLSILHVFFGRYIDWNYFI